MEGDDAEVLLAVIKHEVSAITMLGHFYRDVVCKYLL